MMNWPADQVERGGKTCAVHHGPRWGPTFQTLIQHFASATFSRAEKPFFRAIIAGVDCPRFPESGCELS